MIQANNTSQTVLVVIPARGGSKGIPKKNLRQIHGKPLTEWAILSAERISFRKKVILSSDDPEILSIANKYDFVEPAVRPDFLSGDAVADFKVLRFELSRFEEKYALKFDCIVMLQPTSPIRNPETVNASISSVLTGESSATWTVTKVPLKFHPRKQLYAGRDNLKLVIDTPLVVGRQELDPTFIRTGVCYAMSRETLLNDERLLGANPRAQECRWPHSNIDDLSDLQEAEHLSVGYDGILIPKGGAF
jgi:CMP-N-acetylneuraminic acid synthetase